MVCGLFIFSLTYTDNSLNLILKVPVKMIEEAKKLKNKPGKYKKN